MWKTFRSSKICGINGNSDWWVPSLNAGHIPVGLSPLHPWPFGPMPGGRLVPPRPAVSVAWDARCLTGTDPTRPLSFPSYSPPCRSGRRWTRPLPKRPPNSPATKLTSPGESREDAIAACAAREMAARSTPLMMTSITDPTHAAPRSPVCQPHPHVVVALAPPKSPAQERRACYQYNGRRPGARTKNARRAP
jgi:hypothetical protein